MAIKLTPESFLNVVRQSNLVTSDVLKRVLTELREDGAAIDSAKAIADHLVERNLLTRWQAEKLLQGKHKGFFLGKYRLLKLLGKGGMSSVYLAEHVLMRRQCAIKVLPTKRVNDTSYLGRFHREAQAVASLDHPNIVRAYDVDKEMEKDAEIHFLVMEFVDGRSLQEIVQQDGPLCYQTAADYIRQSAEGLAHAHDAGMVHRDIKPGNLLIDRNETVKLLDMGLARFFHEGDEESLTVAHDEKVLGTADYLAPEQALDSHSVDARADLYSLGCTFYFLLTGHPPFVEGTLAQRLMCHQTKQPPPVTNDRPDMPKDLLPILEKMMAKKREDRYQTAFEIARDLGLWLVEHASDEWQQTHPGLSGKKSGDNGQNLAPPKKKSSIIKKPAPPAAKLVAKEPEPVAEPSGPESDAGLELSAFLANLGTSDSLHSDSEVLEEDSPKGRGSSKSSKKRPDSGKVPSPQKPPEAAPARAQTAQPVSASPVGKPSAQPLAAKPVVSAKAAANAPPSARPAVPVASTAIEDEPDFPPFENEFSIDTSPHLPDLTIADTPSQSRLRAPKTAKIEWKTWLKDKRVLAGLLGLAVLLLSWGAYWLATRGDDSGNEVVDRPQADLDDGRLIGQTIRVGSDGSFKTLKEALDYVDRHKDLDNFPELQVIELQAGEEFADSIHLENPKGDEFPNAICIRTEAQNPATLKPGGTEPVIHLAKGINDLIIENLKIAADGKKVAIHVAGELINTQLKNLDITGYELVGLKAESAFGTNILEAKPFLIENCRFRGLDSETTGMLLENTGGFGADALEEIVVRGCQFLAPMRTGLEIKNDVTSLQVLSCIFAGDGTGTGIEWTGRTGLNRVIVANNTFYNLAKGISFETLPGTLIDSRLHRNLFSQIKQQEAALLQGDVSAFTKQFLTGPTLEANVTTGGKPSPEDKQELNVFTGQNSKTDSQVAFSSTEPGNKKFLAPQDDVALPKPGDGQIQIGPLTVKLKPYIGAVAP